MKRFLLILLVMFAPRVVDAQVPVSHEPPLVNQFVEDALEQRSAAWWKALERQLILTLDKPANHVAEVSLQNVIYFANNHGHRLDLSDAVQPLMEIYRHHDRVGFRMMALSALHVIGDQDAIEEAFQFARRSDSDRIRRMARAALADVYRRNR